MKRFAEGDGKHVSLKLNYESFGRVKAFLAAMRLAGSQQVIRSIDQTAFAWQREIQRHIPVDEGTARMSVQVRKAEQKQDGRIVGAVGTNVEYACVLGCRHTVTTSNGPKQISSVKPGDMVLTQTGEYRKVIAINSFHAIHKPDVVTIKVPWRNGKNHILHVSHDHKILVYRDGRNKWVEAGDMVETDCVYVRRKKSHKLGVSKHDKPCRNCGTSTRRRLFCSIKCRAEYWSRTGTNPHIGAKRSDETREKQSKRIRIRLRDNPESHPNRILAKRGAATSAEAKVEAWLISQGLEFDRQRQIAGRFVDFWVPSTKTAYEADGAYWHQDQSVDIERDKEILGVVPDATIVHFHFHSQAYSRPLNPNPLPNVHYVVCNPDTHSFADPSEFVARKVQSIRKWVYGEKKTHRNDARRTRYYDLTVDTDHSFVCNGILISNSYLEFGGEGRARGLIRALALWKEGSEPILHWYAKDMGIADLEAKRDKARNDKSRANYQKRLDKASSSSHEEFAPPFRGSWQLIAESVVRRLRSNLARLIRTGKLSEGSP